jgi:hypothetical protein
MTSGSLLGRDPSGMWSKWLGRFAGHGPHGAGACRALFVKPSSEIVAPCSHLPSQQTGNSSNSTSSCLPQQRLLQHSAMHTTAASVGHNTDTQASLHTRAHMCTHTHAHTQAHAHTHTNTNARTHTHIHMHAHKHTDTHARKHTHTHTCICMHTLRASCASPIF